MDLYDKLKKYFDETHKEQVLKDWKETGIYDNVNSPTVEQLLLHNVSNRLTKEDLETIKEHRDLMNDVIRGNYKPDTLTNQPINKLIDRLENGC